MASIVEIGPRQWHVFASSPPGPDGKRPRRSRRVNGTKVDARRVGRELEAELDKDTFKRRQPSTLEKWVEKAWWPTKRRAVRQVTARNYRRLLDREILPRLGSQPIRQITGAEISTLLGAVQERGAESLADHLFVFMRLMFNAAVEQDVLDESPMKGVERPRVQRRERQILKPSDWNRVRRHLATKAPQLLAPVTVLLTTGLRRGELCGLRWADIDFDRSLAFVRRSFLVVDGKQVWSEPKTQRSRRVVALDPGTLDVLREHREMQEDLLSLFGERITDSTPVFTADMRTPYRPDTLTRAWHKVSEDLGLGVTLHDLRHSSASVLISMGVPIGDVSDRLGHATAGFTLTVYRHAMPGAQEAAAARLAKAFQISARSDQLLAAD